MSIEPGMEAITVMLKLSKFQASQKRSLFGNSEQRPFSFMSSAWLFASNQVFVLLMHEFPQ